MHRLVRGSVHSGAQLTLFNCLARKIAGGFFPSSNLSAWGTLQKFPQLPIPKIPDHRLRACFPQLLLVQRRQHPERKDPRRTGGPHGAVTLAGVVA
ncbi:hypothetical protein Y602_5279 [Burkholderia pseudomallei MSHR733]|nr:hypothetical protein Y602_5279 [Burkholderia pseudomallei MSHR733]